MSLARECSLYLGVSVSSGLSVSRSACISECLYLGVPVNLGSVCISGVSLLSECLYLGSLYLCGVSLSRDALSRSVCISDGSVLGRRISECLYLRGFCNLVVPVLVRVCIWGCPCTRDCLYLGSACISGVPESGSACISGVLYLLSGLYLGSVCIS